MDNKNMIVTNFDNEVIYNGPSDQYPPYLKEDELLKSTEIKVWKLNIRGYFNKQFFDGTLQKGFADTTYGQGIIIFKGTFKELSEVETTCHKNGIKVIGSKLYKP